MTFSLNLSTAFVPPATAFTVLVNSVIRTVNAVSVSGTDVSLTLASSIVSGDVVTIAYTIPSSNALRSSTGWYVLTFGSQLVTNNVSSDSIRPVLINATVENSTPSILTMTFSLNLSTASVPPSSAFTVMVNSLLRTVSSVAISGSDVILALSGPIVSGDVITVAYTISANALRSVPGWYVLSFGAQPVTNNVTSARPGLLSAMVEFTAPTIITMDFNINLSTNYLPNVSAFTVIVNSVPRIVNSIAISGSKVLLTLASKIVYGDVITVAYTIPSLNALRSVPGWYVLSFTAQPVTNTCLASSSMRSQKSDIADDSGLQISSGSGTEYIDDSSIISGDITVYPNPATDYINIFIPEPSSGIQLLRIFNYSGKICMEIRLEPEVHNLHIPLNLGSGNYILKVTEGNMPIFTKKIVILN